MFVRLPKQMLLDDRTLATMFNLDSREMSYRDHYDVNLASFDAKLLKRAQQYISESLVRGSKTLARDISTWLSACEGVKGARQARARSTQKACALLIEYLRHSPHKHLYQRVQKGADGVTLCYYIEDVIFHPREQHSGYTVPDHITVDLIYEEFGVRQSTRWKIYPEGCIGMTPVEIIHLGGYMRETEALRDDYEFYLDLYGKWHEKIGKQFFAVGIADDTGVDGNDKEERRNSWWYSSKTTKLLLDKDGVPSRVVADIFREEDKDKEETDCRYNQYFWNQQINVTGGVTALDEDADDETVEINGAKPAEIPIHPFIVCFDLARHKRLRIHVGNLTEYKYDASIRERLILPERCARLIDTLLVDQKNKFKDIVKGKSGGTIILCQGRPGTGKTLTAEVYAEALGRALYTVQCSQLGTDPEELESNLLKVLARGRRWGAVMLLDEADVYVHERGSDLQQNAIVGVFLRVLEYHSGVLFMTTNRGDLVDDAILSRCTARVPYKTPAIEDQQRIWSVLAEANGIELTPKTIQRIVAAHPKLSGRDIKNLLKLAAMVAHDRKEVIDADLITEVKVFKPTTDEEE